jgi:CIC family chloride channel protein
MKIASKEMAWVIVVGLLQTVAMVVIAQGLIKLITLFTNIFYAGQFSFGELAPSHSLLTLFSPVLGGLIVGVMARFGSKAIRGHDIPS